jgi:hypothetical protein
MCLKWDNKASFELHLQRPCVFDAMRYSMEVCHMVCFPEMNMWEKVNDMHDKIQLGRLGQSLTQHMHQHNQQTALGEIMRYHVHQPQHQQAASCQQPKNMYAILRKTDACWETCQP